MQLLIKNGFILQSNGTFTKGHIGIDGGKIASVWYGDTPPDTAVKKIDAGPFLVSPGFIDTHVHGGMGFDFSYEKEGWENMAERLASHGVTSILATISSLPPDMTLKLVSRTAALAEKNGSSKVNIAGIHMEGPYMNKNKKGIHLEANIRPGDKDEVKRILDKANGLIKVWTMAPEFAENMALIETLAAAGVSVSIAHTEADYDTAMAAFSAGANRVTHTFNTMPVLHQRYKGIVTAAWQHGAFMELIGDGQHVSPTMARMLVSATDPGKLVLISDNNEFGGLPDGSYIQDNRRLIIENGQMKTEDGVFAGSIICMNECARNLLRWGFSAGTALTMAAENPARSIGIFDHTGNITTGKDADLVILDDQFEVMMTIKGGEIVFTARDFSG